MARYIRPVAVDPLPTSGQLDDIRRVLESPADVLLPVPSADSARADRVIEVADPRLPLRPSEESSEDPTVLAVATSGSTGAPRVVLLTKSALDASATASAERLGGPGQWLLALGVEHIAGIQVVLRSLRAGHAPVTCVAGGADFCAQFVRATDQLSAERRYVSLVPTQLRRLLDAPGMAAVQALSAYHAVLLGGAAADQHLLDEAAAAGVSVVTSYGMSETAGGCVYDGEPLAGVDVQVEGEVGPITLRGTVLGRGYRGGDSMADNPFRDGSFRTSDAGSIRNGRLAVLGRTDDLINTGGKKVSPDEVMAALLAVPGVSDCAVVGIPDPLWGQIVAAAVVADLTPAQLRTALQRTLPAYAAPKLIRRVREVPRMGIGKLDRAAVLDLLTG